jgi:hypothetical protein
MREQVACPKCGRERRPGEEACARCGLRTALWDGWREEMPSIPALDEAWEKLQHEWEDERAHRRFLEQAAQLDALDLAAAHYRQRRRENPNDARAEEGLKRAAQLAVNVYAQKAQAERTTPPSGWWRVGGLIGALVIILAGFWVAWILMRR